MCSRRRVIAGGIALLVYALIFLMSSIPARSLPAGIPDFIPHFIEYLLLAFFFIQAFARPRQASTQVAAALLLAVLGLLDEVHQLWTPGRVFSCLDLLVDILGAGGGLLAFRCLAGRKPGKTGGMAGS